MNIKKSIFFISILFLGTLLACNNNRLNISVDNQKVDLKIDRFEKELFSIPPEKISIELPKLEYKYPKFYQLYFENILRFGEISNPEYLQVVKDFVSNPDIKTLEKDIDSTYENFEPIKKELEEGFKHYKFYFPNGHVPNIITFNSTFNNGIVTMDSAIGIGLDMFLGSNYKYYPSVGFPNYMIRRLNKEHLSATVFKGFAKYLYEENQKDQSLVSQMIYEGKILYFLNAMFPEKDDSITIGYSGKQIKWCRENEVSVWAFFLENDLLYSMDIRENLKYLNDGPFTSSISNEAPAMLGVWTGWQIVRKYMDKHKEVGLKELMNKPFEEVLKGSGYKPK